MSSQGHGGDATNTLVDAQRNEGATQRILLVQNEKYNAFYRQIWRQLCTFGI